MRDAAVAAQQTFTQLNPSHVAVQVRDIVEARHFYKDVLGCEEGRSDAGWVDFNLYGHQLVCHPNPHLGKQGKIAARYSPVDGHTVPVPHCGVVLDMNEWNELGEWLKQQRVEFVIEPRIRFKGAPGAPGEQGTMFLRDPAGHALEFNSFRDIARRLSAS